MPIYFRLILQSKAKATLNELKQDQPKKHKKVLKTLVLMEFVTLACKRINTMLFKVKTVKKCLNPTLKIEHLPLFGSFGIMALIHKK